MENETKIETMEQVREAIAVLAREVVNQREMEVATGRLAQGMDARLKLLTALLDRIHDVLEKHGMMPPRPKKGVFDVN